MKHSKNMRITAITDYLLQYIFWACLECIIVPKLETQTLPVSVELIKEIGCKILFWVLPSVFLILRHSDSMFLLIHFPIWLREGVWTAYMTSPAFILLIVLSLIFSRTFVKSRSILVPIILHAYWDLLCFAIE